MKKPFHNLRKKRVFYINESLEKELGEEYFFDGTYVLKNGEVLKQCSTWEKMVIENIYKDKSGVTNTEILQQSAFHQG